MKLLSGVISISVSFWMFIYLYGLQAVQSEKYNPSFNLLATLLLIIAIICFYNVLKDYFLRDKKKNK
ncbi:hypothetical protein AB9M62_14545 [Bacillales bacterium AN1005]|uniref:hypothetical protein n=1 Tax=Niallia taxi TaxID=2499688 RepID=UPI0021A35884|nr:hypothetical protein [Niallia taxi]MCT2347191.1 hypothetical protein [Niallia taxi]